MKKISKILVIALVVATLAGACVAFAACDNGSDAIVVYTNAFLLLSNTMKARISSVLISTL